MCRAAYAGVQYVAAMPTVYAVFRLYAAALLVCCCQCSVQLECPGWGSVASVAWPPVLDPDPSSSLRFSGMDLCRQPADVHYLLHSLLLPPHPAVVILVPGRSCRRPVVVMAATRATRTPCAARSPRSGGRRSRTVCWGARRTAGGALRVV